MVVGVMIRTCSGRLDSSCTGIVRGQVRKDLSSAVSVVSADRDYCPSSGAGVEQESQSIGRIEVVRQVVAHPAPPMGCLTALANLLLVSD